MRSLVMRLKSFGEGMLNMISKIVGVILVCLFLFFGLKGCIHFSWESHSKPMTYSIRGVDGRELSIIFLPEFETMMWYVDPNRNFTEGVLTKMIGSYGTHYLGPIWRVDGPRAGGLLGFRWLPSGQEPVNMEITHLDKYTEGRGESAFGETPKTFYTVILKEKDRIQFQGMWFNLVSSDSNKIAGLRARFKKTE
jgi:hypothetical protein